MRGGEAGGATGARRPAAGRRHGRLAAAALSLALSVALSGAPGATAAAARPGTDDVTDARARAHAIEAQVAALQPRVRAALAAYDDALGDLASAVTTDVRASARLDAAEQEAAAARSRRDRRVRALYKAGGPALLYASVLDARSVRDAVDRVGYAERVVADQDAIVASAAGRVTAARRTAATTSTRAAASVTTVRDVLDRAAALEAVLAEQQRRLDAADARVRAAEGYAAARARLAATRAAVASLTDTRLGAARALPPPAEFLRLYRAAAPTCSGLPWTVLAAIGQVESGHGANSGVSSAGAVGPMQFLPATFAAYAVDGDGDGDRDIGDPADAVFTAARYLCANGAGDPATLPQAIWHYNHADWYVRLVLRLAGQYAA